MRFYFLFHRQYSSRERQRENCHWKTIFNNLDVLSELTLQLDKWRRTNVKKEKRVRRLRPRAIARKVIDKFPLFPPLQDFPFLAIRRVSSSLPILPFLVWPTSQVRGQWSANVDVSCRVFVLAGRHSAVNQRLGDFLSFVRRAVIYDRWP